MNRILDHRTEVILEGKASLQVNPAPKTAKMLLHTAVVDVSTLTYCLNLPYCTNVCKSKGTVEDL